MPGAGWTKRRSFGSKARARSERQEIGQPVRGKDQNVPALVLEEPLKVQPGAEIAEPFLARGGTFLAGTLFSGAGPGIGRIGHDDIEGRRI